MIGWNIQEAEGMNVLWQLWDRGIKLENREVKPQTAERDHRAEQSSPCSAWYAPPWHLFPQGIVTSRGHTSKKLLSTFGTHTYTHTDSHSGRSQLWEGVHWVGEWWQNCSGWFVRCLSLSLLIHYCYGIWHKLMALFYSDRQLSKKDNDFDVSSIGSVQACTCHH